MALNAQQQGELVNALVSKGGYNQADAQVAASNSGGRADELYREFTGGSKPSSGGSSFQLPGQTNIEANRQYREDEIKSMGLEAEAWHKSGNEITINGQVFKVVNNGNGTRSFVPLGSSMQRAVDQGASALEGQKGLVRDTTTLERGRLEQEKTSLQQRYMNIIDDMKASTEQAITRSRGVAEQELANRGINLQGNAAGQEITNVLNPINESLTRSLRDVSQAQEDDIFQIVNLISKLPLNEQQQLLAIDQAIAQLKMQGAQFDANQALQIAQLQLAQMNAERQGQLQDLQISQAGQTFPLQLQQMQEELTAQQLANQKAKKSLNTSPLQYGDPYELDSVVPKTSPKVTSSTGGSGFTHLNPEILPYISFDK